MNGDGHRTAPSPRRARRRGGAAGDAQLFQGIQGGAAAERAGEQLRRRRRDGRGGEPTVVPEAEFRSYYGRPVLKPPVWEREIPAYLFTGGLAAGTAVLAAGADLTGRPALRRGELARLVRRACWPACGSWSRTSAGPSGSTTCCGWPSRRRR